MAHGYAHNPREATSVKVYGRSLRVSTRNSIQVCRAVNGMNLQKGKAFLEAVLNEKRSIDGKHYYTNASKELLGLLKSGEGNAEAKGLDTDRMVIHASAHTGFRLFTPRRLKLRGRQRKVTNIQVVMEQR
jgi:large subunit ribosomal protein L22